MTAIDNPSRHQFEIDLGDDGIAFAKYALLPGAMRFYHTVVPDRLRGQGIGTALVEAGLAAARDRDLKVIPSCPFFADYLKRHPELQDMVPADERHLIGI